MFLEDFSSQERFPIITHFRLLKHLADSVIWSGEWELGKESEEASFPGFWRLRLLATYMRSCFSTLLMKNIQEKANGSFDRTSKLRKLWLIRVYFHLVGRKVSEARKGFRPYYMVHICIYGMPLVPFQNRNFERDQDPMMVIVSFPIGFKPSINPTISVSTARRRRNCAWYKDGIEF